MQINRKTSQWYSKRWCIVFCCQRRIRVVWVGSRVLHLSPHQPLQIHTSFSDISASFIRIPPLGTSSHSHLFPPSVETTHSASPWSARPSLPNSPISSNIPLPPFFPTPPHPGAHTFLPLPQLSCYFHLLPSPIPECHISLFHLHPFPFYPYPSLQFYKDGVDVKNRRRKPMQRISWKPRIVIWERRVNERRH